MASLQVHPSLRESPGAVRAMLVQGHDHAARPAAEAISRRIAPVEAWCTIRRLTAG
jgi:hypothetical protein